MTRHNVIAIYRSYNVSRQAVTAIYIPRWSHPITRLSATRPLIMLGPDLQNTLRLSYIRLFYDNDLRGLCNLPNMLRRTPGFS